MEDIVRQIVVQITSSKTKRAIVQYEADQETGITPDQKIINFDNLTAQEKEYWNSFVDALKNK